MTCSVCSHRHRMLIDERLRAGTTYSELAAKYGVGRSTVARHNRHRDNPPVPPPRYAPITIHELDTVLATEQRLQSALAITQAAAAVLLRDLEESRGHPSGILQGLKRFAEQIIARDPSTQGELQP